MVRFAAERLAMALLVLLAVSVVAFTMARLGGDPAFAIAGEGATAAEIAAVRAHYGLDRPVHEQYLVWAASALRADFGDSYHFRRPVSEMIAARLPVTMTLGALALGFALILAIPLGVVAALYHDTIIDRVALLVAVVGQAMPTFWFALIMMIVFGVTLRWLPVSGAATWAHFVMPTIALGYFAMPALMRLTRAGMLEALASDHIRTARAFGLHRRVIYLRRALRSALAPVVALAMVQLGFMLGGSIVIETVFSLPGIGWLGYDAIQRGDLPVLQSIVLIVACFYVVLTFSADVLNAVIDPRIRVR